MKRLAPSVFKIPADKLRAGYYSDRYFLRTRDVLRALAGSGKVGYQFFPREDAVICGLDEAVAILKTCSGKYNHPPKAEKWYRELRRIQWNLQAAGFRQNRQQIFHWEKKRTQIRERLNRLWENGWGRLKVFALKDGDRVKKNEAVLAIEGDPGLFVHLETPLLGVIARPTGMATAVARVVKSARQKKILFFSARFDHFWVQTSDGYAALKAGALGVSTDANADYWGVESSGTIPHFLIGCFGGDTAAAFLAFDRHTPAKVNRIALVDWDNDCIGTTRRLIAKLIEKKITGRPVTAAKATASRRGLDAAGFLQSPEPEAEGIPERGDMPRAGGGEAKRSRPLTESEFLKYASCVIGSGKGKLWGVRFDTSQSLRDRSVTSRGRFSCGVCPELVKKARREFDRWGCRRLKIVASGGFDEKKIERFERLKTPVDVYGVGSSLLRHKIDITADIVQYDGRPCAKAGRHQSDWSRLERVL